MAINTFSAWTYGHTVNLQNNAFDFVEDTDPTVKTARLTVGSYSLGDFINQLAISINTVATVGVFTVTLDRSTRVITISSTTDFDILINSGSNSTVAIYDLAGFTGNVDLTGSNTYAGDSSSGLLYIPEFKLQDYVPFNNRLRTIEANVKETSSGQNVEIVGYGRVNFMECNISYVNNFNSNGPLGSKTNAVDELRDFLDYITLKNPIEFFPDRDDLSTNSFTKCILERTQLSSNGVDYEIRELTTSRNYFESGRLEFRQIN